MDTSIFNQQKKLAAKIFKKGLRLQRPEHAIHNNVSRMGDLITIGESSFTLVKGQKLWVFGSGKAAGRMARALETILSDIIYDGIVIVPQGSEIETKIIQTFEASHPIPDDSSETATLEMLATMNEVQPNDVVIYLMSGGSSALLCKPAEGLTIEEIQQTWQALLKSGMSIQEMNTVRIHLSDIKGGQMLAHLQGVTIHNLLISDVPDDDPEFIGSGPLVPTSKTFENAWHLIQKYALQSKLPYHVVTYLRSKAKRNERLTDFSGYSDCHTYMISTARILAEEFARLGEKYELNTWLAPSAYANDARVAAREISAKAIAVLARDEEVAKPALLVFYGESTVKVTGKGKGGRNLEIALATAMAIEGQHHITMLSAGTDGKDGETNAAGAFCTSNTALIARKKDLAPESFLKNNDSFSFFEAMDDLLLTGPTGTNLMDVQLVFIAK